MTDWRQDIRQTDRGTVRYACGHGAKCEHTHNSTRVCDQCLADMPNLAQYNQMKDEVVTEVEEIIDGCSMEDDTEREDSDVSDADCETQMLHDREKIEYV